jgi:hypothetical protein
MSRNNKKIFIITENPEYLLRWDECVFQEGAKRSVRSFDFQWFRTELQKN